MRQDKTNDLLHLNGKYGDITITHNLYGNQVVRGKINILATEDKIGVIVRGQDIYLNNDEILDIVYSNSSASIIGSYMSINISTK